MTNIGYAAAMRLLMDGEKLISTVTQDSWRYDPKHNIWYVCHTGGRRELPRSHGPCTRAAPFSTPECAAQDA